MTDGVLTIETAAPTSTLPRFDSAKVPVEQGTVLRAAGSLGVTRIPAGSAQAVLREYDDAGAFVRDTVLADLTQIGEVEFGRNFGPGGTAYAATSTQVAILLRMSGASANLTMQAKHLKLLPFASDLRKYEFAAAGSGEADNPDAAPLTPVSASSFVAYGPPPLPPGGDLPEEEPPVEIVGFENGSWSAGWVEFLSGGATASIDAAAAIHGTLGAHFTDPGAGSGVAFRRKTFDSMDGLSFGLRKLIRVPQRPTHGYVTLMRILNTIATQAFVSIRYHSDGRLVLIVFYPAKNLLSGVNLLEGVESGSTIDLEGVVTGLNSKNGLVSVGVGLNGEPRQSVYYEGNIDYRGYFAKTGEVGVAAASDSRARWDLHYDQVVVTKSGDVLNRERPPAPSGFVPPPPDRPRRALLTRTPSTTYAVGDERVPTPYNGHAYVVASQTGPTGTAEPTWPTASGATVVDGGVTWKEAGTSYREFDPDGERGNQAYVFVAPGEGPVTADVLDRPIAVKPGATYPLSVFSRWSVFGDAAPGVKVWLEGDGVEPLLAASLGEMAGTRGWHPTGDEDDSVTFTVPALEYDGSKPLPSYSRARIEATLTEGVYVFQDPAFSQGPLSGFFARDAKRGYGRATTGEIAAILPTFPEAYGAGLDSGVFWSELGVKLASDIDAVTDPNDGVDVFFSTSRDGVLFGPEETVRDAVVTDAYLRIRAVLTGNGRDGPVIPSGGIFLRTWSPLAVLLRPDGSHFPGVAYVDERIYATTYPDAEVARVGGRHQTVETTGDIGRIYDVRIGATTEAAMQEIDRLSLSDELVLELPKAGGTVGGVAYLVRLRGRTKFDPGGLILVNGEHRQMRGIATVEEAEILEAAVLPGPRTNLVAGA